MADDAFIPPLARYFPLTTPYGAPTAAGENAGDPHLGLDFGAPFGEPVFAMRPGVVLAPNANPDGVTGGNTVTIDYGDGIIATVAHLSSVLVKPGDRVASGQAIGAVGNSGITTGRGGTSGSHLHLETWRRGVKLNPLDLFDWAAGEIDASEYDSAAFGDLLDQLTDEIKDHVGKDTWGEFATRFSVIRTGPTIEQLHSALKDTEYWDKTIAVEDVPAVVALILEAKISEKAPWDAAAEAVGDIAGVFGALVNPATWARVFAMILGFVMAAMGFYIVWAATGGIA